MKPAFPGYAGEGFFFVNEIAAKARSAFSDSLARGPAHPWGLI
jgi:hypothetical protein